MFESYNSGAEKTQAAAPGGGMPPEGRHRLRVEDAKAAVSKSSGRDMVVITFSVCGYEKPVWHYIVDNEYAQRNLDEFFDSFGIVRGNFDFKSWYGHKGAGELKHSEYKGNPAAAVKRFIPRSKQHALPEWSSALDTADDGAAGDGYPF